MGNVSVLVFVLSTMMAEYVQSEIRLSDPITTNYAKKSTYRMLL